VNAAFVPAHFQNAASGLMHQACPFTSGIESDYFREVKWNDRIRKSLENESANAQLDRKAKSLARQGRL